MGLGLGLARPRSTLARDVRVSPASDVRVILTDPDLGPDPGPNPHQERLRSRGVASPAEVEFMMMWNSDRQGAPPLVSDSALAGACRRFVKAHAERLRTSLRLPLVAHLRALASHNLLCRDDLVDCMVIVDANGSTSSKGKSPGKAKSPKRSKTGVPSGDASVETCNRCERPQHQPDCTVRKAARVPG